MSANLLQLSCAAMLSILVVPTVKAVEAPEQSNAGTSWLPGPHTCRNKPPNEPWQQRSALAAPIRVGGVRYDINETQMTAICRERRFPLPDGSYLVGREFTGYRISVPVDGDFGQPLAISLTGRSSHALQLSVHCGSFSGTDSGTRFIIQREQQNQISCQRMDIVLQSDSVTEPEVDLSIMLTERI